MILSPLIIRSTLSSKILHKALFRGFAIALVGILILVIAAIFLPVPEMKTWGWSLFLISLALITFGLLPYRRLARLQMKPNELTLVDSDHLTYTLKGKKILTLPLQSVERMHYISHSEKYGVAIWLKPTPIAPIIIHQLPKEVDKLRQLGHLNEEADLFFPYFNERAFNELIEWQKDEEYL